MSNQLSIDVSIIIVNYNTASMTMECIDSVFRLTEGISYEVILVDNASTDNSKELFSKDDRITYIYNDENLGFGRANNIAIEISRGRNILFLNSDTLLINNAIRILSDYLDSHPKTGACGGNLYNRNGDPEHSFQKLRPSLWSELDALFEGKLLLGKNTDHNFSNTPFGVSYICGADLMVKSDVLKLTGAFDPVFFMYYEEAELCYRIRRKGFEIDSVPAAKITHLVRGSFKNHVPSLIYEKSRAEYYSLTHSKVHFFVANAIRLFVYSLKMLSPREETRKRWRSMKAVWDQVK